MKQVFPRLIKPRKPRKEKTMLNPSTNNRKV